MYGSYCCGVCLHTSGALLSGAGNKRGVRAVFWEAIVSGKVEDCGVSPYEVLFKVRVLGLRFVVLKLAVESNMPVDSCRVASENKIVAGALGWRVGFEEGMVLVIKLDESCSERVSVVVGAQYVPWRMGFAEDFSGALLIT